MNIYKNFDGNFITDCKSRRSNFYKDNDNKLKQLLNICFWTSDIKEAIRCFIHDIQSPPKCNNCGKFVGGVSLKSPCIYPYKKFCNDSKCQEARFLSTHSDKSTEKRIKTNIIRYGYDNPSKNQDVVDKIKKTTKNLYGVTNAMHLDHFKEKQKCTLLERYNVDHIFKCKSFVDKRKITFLKKYGVDNPFKDPYIIEQMKNTRIKNYGSHSGWVENIINKSKLTYLDKWGVDHYLKCEEGQSIWNDAFLKKTGYRHPMHNPVTVDKQNKSSFLFKKYISALGNEYKVQGYEHFAVEILESWGVGFVNEKIDVGNISYRMHDIDRKYYPDFYISDYDVYIEVKSMYTFLNDEYKIACIRECNPDINLIVIIFNHDGLVVKVL
jgi:hypothetical protein